MVRSGTSVAGGESGDHPQRLEIQPSAVPLVGKGGIGKAVAQHDAPAAPGAGG